MESTERNDTINLQSSIFNFQFLFIRTGDKAYVHAKLLMPTLYQPLAGPTKPAHFKVSMPLDKSVTKR